MNELKFNIIADTFGADKIDTIKTKLSSLGSVTAGLESNLTKFASATYLMSKGLELGSVGIESFKQIVDMGEHFAVLSEKTGVAAYTISQFENAAKQSNVPVETLEKSLKKFTQNLGDVNNEKFTDAMKALGISTRDASGSIKGSDVALKELSDKFAGMENSPGKAAIAVALFGKSGSDMIPVLNMGSAEIEKYGFKMGNEFPERAKKFNDSIEQSKKLLKEQETQIVNDMLPGLQTVIDSYNEIQKLDSGTKAGKGLGEFIAGATDIVYELGTGIVNVVDVVGTAIFDILKMIKAVFDELMDTIKGIGTAISTLAKGDFKNIFSGFDGAGSKLKQFLIDQRELGSNLWDRLSERSAKAEKFGQLTSSGFQRSDDSKSGTGIAPSVEDKKYKNEADKLAKYAIGQAEVINKERLLIDSYDLSSTELKKLTLAEEIRMQAQKETVGWETSAKQAYLDTAEAVIKQRQALIDLEQKQRETFSVGARRAFNDYIDRIKDVASQTQSLFTNAFQSMENSLVNFVKTGKLSFQDFANVVIDSLIRIAVQRATLGFLTSVGMAAASAPSTSVAAPKPSDGTGYIGGNYQFISKFADGGIVSKTGVMPLSKFANGGVVNSPHFAVFGEAGPEAFVPLPDGRRIPVVMDNNSSGSVSVVVNVNMATGEEKVSGNNEAQALGKMISVAVKQEILNQKRPGGILS